MCDYFAVSDRTATKLQPPEVNESGHIPVHEPVHLTILDGDPPARLRAPCEPAALPKRPSVGCSRSPLSWERALLMSPKARDSSELAHAWDLTVAMLEGEWLGRLDIAGARSWWARYAQAKWAAPRARPQISQVGRAWAT
eukprot:4931665-Pyramimonas_sp.AAC.1